MAAPLPTGSQIASLPQAPNIGDPRSYSFDPVAALSAAHVGAQVGKELATLQNLGAEIELRSAQIDAERARLKAEKIQHEHAVTQLSDPAFRQLLTDTTTQSLKAQLATGRLAEANAVAPFDAKIPAATAANTLAGLKVDTAGKEAFLQNEVPQTQAAAAGMQATNALASAAADAPLAAQPLATRVQTETAAKTKGGWGIAPGEQADDGVPYVFREVVPVQDIDPKTGNTQVRYDVLDKRTGKTVVRGEPVATAKLGVDEKSVNQASQEATHLFQTIGLADALTGKLQEYAKGDKGGLWQAIATKWANEPTNSVIAVAKKSVGQRIQTPGTTDVVGAISSLRNVVGNTLFGASLTKNESEQLNGMLPVPEDVANPAVAMQKLDNVKAFLRTKLQPYEQRGIPTKMGLGSAPGAAPVPAANLTRDLKDGQTIWVNGKPVQARLVGGRWYALPTQ